MEQRPTVVRVLMGKSLALRQSGEDLRQSRPLYLEMILRRAKGVPTGA